jgi:hypothetical protein
MANQEALEKLNPLFQGFSFFVSRFPLSIININGRV